MVSRKEVADLLNACPSAVDWSHRRFGDERDTPFRVVDYSDKRPADARATFDVVADDIPDKGAAALLSATGRIAQWALERDAEVMRREAQFASVVAVAQQQGHTVFAEITNAIQRHPPRPCTCWTCDTQNRGKRMYLCDTCGNKRCPHATDHRRGCTNSNEPDQSGSRYSSDYERDNEQRLGELRELATALQRRADSQRRYATSGAVPEDVVESLLDAAAEFEHQSRVLLRILT